MDVRQTLIDVFADHDCAAIENDVSILLQAFALGSFEEVRSMPNYGAEYNRVKTAKAHLERIATNYAADNGDQALQCLNLLRQRRSQTVYRSADYDVTRALVEVSLYRSWPTAHREEYVRRRSIFDDWCDFFISYTNRDSNETNKRYRPLITRHLGWPKPADVQRTNYVARVIAKLLEQQNIRGFADYQTLQCGDELLDKIVTHCSKAFAFVQLGEWEAFKEPPPAITNWCFTEYQAFVQARAAMGAAQSNQIFFTFAGAPPLEPPAGLKYTGYIPWFQQMQARLTIMLDNHKAPPFDTLRAQIKNVADQIVQAREDLMRRILASWI